MASYLLACCLLAPVAGQLNKETLIQPVSMLDEQVLESVITGDSGPSEDICCDSECWSCRWGPLAGCESDPLEQLTLFAGLDGSKQPQDLGLNAHLGGRVSANYSLSLFPELGIGGQVGGALNYSDSAVRVLELVEGSKERFQTFATVGLFRNGERLRFGIVYDFSSTNYYDNYDLSQWRGRLGWKLNECHELGCWFAIGGRGDRTFFDGPLGAEFFQVDPLSQAHLYWRKSWDYELETTLWLGVSEGHGEVIATIPGNPAVNQRMVFGADVHIPLDDHLAIFGEANFVAPSDSGSVDSYLGLVYYPDGGARRGRVSRYSAILPVASNPTMTVDLRR